MNVITRSRLVSAAAGAAFLVSFLGTATVAHAAPLTSVQISAITNLLQAFGADTSVIANVQAALMGVPVVTASSTATSTSTSTTSNNSGFPSGFAQPPASSCSVLSGNLGIGARGSEVEQLQSFLAKNGDGVAVTGFYGRLTEDAVRRWQAAHNIVATGTPSTTGYGTVGPRTRGEMDKKMEVECESKDASEATASSTDSSTASSTDAHSSESGTASTTTSQDSNSNSGSSDN